jgi:glutamyl-tRNA synthetase
MSELENEIRVQTLKNAVLHGGKAQPKAVMGKIMGRAKGQKPNELIKIVEKVVKEVNKLSIEEQKEEVEKLKISFEKVKKVEKGLIDLPEAEMDKVVTRAAPNPDGAIHVGNARQFVLSYLYAKKYNGRFVLRYDDTDPKTKRPEKIFYKWILEDLKWLGCKPDLIVYASDRMDVYYEFAYELLRNGNAYVCTCNPDKWKKLRDDKKACPCRDLKPEVNLERWHKMLDEYKEGQAVVRIKTDLKHPNPAVRDWPALRILEAKHPRVGSDYRVWPLYNFASAIDDHELGITHVIRGQEHTTNEVKQSYIYKHFGWKEPVAVHTGRLSLKGMVLSKSKTRNGIKSGEYCGWDDPRLGTIKALRRRGFHKETIVEVIKQVGLKTSDAIISLENLSAINKKIVDPKANRYFFVSNPVKIEVLKPLKKGLVKIPKHPDKPKSKRTLKVEKVLFIEKDDYKKLKGKSVRLLHLYNVKLSQKSKCVGTEVIQDMPKIHWVPKGQETKVKVVMPDDSIIKGLAEKNLSKEKVGAVVQFERFGFVRIDQKKPLVCYFGHK